MSDGVDLSALRFTTDLRLDVDGVQTRVSGEGQRLTVTTDEPIAFLRAIRRSVPEGASSYLGQAIEAFDQSGLTVALADHNGPIVEIGAAVVPSLLGRLVGLPRARIVRLSYIFPTAARVIALALVGVVGGAIAIRSRRQ